MNQTFKQNCNLCDVKGSGNNIIRKHLRASHPGTKTFKCDQCSYECNWKGKIRTHKAPLHEQAPNECDRCDYKMKWKPPFLEHRRQKHGIFVRKPKNHEEMQFAESLCESCGFSAWSVKELRRHMPDDYNDKEELICQSCDELFEKEEVLRFHITGIHEDDKDKKENKQPTAMVSIVTITCRMIEISGNKLGPSWAKIRHN